MPTTKRKYMIVPTAEMQAGDRVKITRTTVHSVTTLSNGQTKITMRSGHSACWLGTERFGIYRTVAA